MRPFKRSASTVDEDNPYWMSFSDVMSALLIIFILASVVLIVELMEMREALDQRHQRLVEEMQVLQRAEEVRKTILQETEKLLLARGIKVRASENDTVLSIPNDILGFGTNEFKVSSDYQGTALVIGEVLSEVIRRENRIEYIDTIFVEGHTDNRPTRGFMGTGNWGLSAFRAISLWQLWSEQLPEQWALDDLQNKDSQPLFSVSGYGPTRPATEQQDTEDELSKNRRIDIRFTIRRPTSAEYRKVDEGFQETAR